eukprot:COSAG02_NODE_1680_length_11353_cov_12.755909_4_plen_543_part_00
MRLAALALLVSLGAQPTVTCAQYSPGSGCWVGDDVPAYHNMIFHTVTDLFFGELIPLANPFCQDFDSDGDLDCLVGTYQGTVKYFRNDGTAAEYSWTKVTDDLFGFDVGTEAAPYCADIDGDDVLDCLVGDFSGFVHHFIAQCGDTDFPPSLMSHGSECWTHASGDYFQDVGSQCSPFCIDIDGDTNIDCLVGEDNGETHHFEIEGNQWTRSSTDFFGTGSEGVGNAVPRCYDFDCDGYVDCVVGKYSGRVEVFKGTQTGTLTQVSDDLFASFNIGAHASPFCADFDADDVVDCIVGQWPEGNVYYFRNQQQVYARSTDETLGLQPWAIALIIVAAFVVLLAAVICVTTKKAGFKDETVDVKTQLPVEEGTPSVRVATQADAAAETTQLISPPAGTPAAAQATQGGAAAVMAAQPEATAQSSADQPASNEAPPQSTLPTAPVTPAAEPASNEAPPQSTLPTAPVTPAAEPAPNEAPPQSTLPTAPVTPAAEPAPTEAPPTQTVTPEPEPEPAAASATKVEAPTGVEASAPAGVPDQQEAPAQ